MGLMLITNLAAALVVGGGAGSGWITTRIGGVSFLAPPGSRAQAEPAIDGRTTIFRLTTTFGRSSARLIIGHLQVGSAALEHASPRTVGEQTIRDLSRAGSAEDSLRIESLVTGTRVHVIRSRSGGARDAWAAVAIRDDSLCTVHWGVPAGEDPHMLEVLRVVASIKAHPSKGATSRTRQRPSPRHRP